MDYFIFLKCMWNAKYFLGFSKFYLNHAWRIGLKVHFWIKNLSPHIFAQPSIQSTKYWINAAWWLKNKGVISTKPTVGLFLDYYSLTLITKFGLIWHKRVRYSCVSYFYEFNKREQRRSLKSFVTFIWVLFAVDVSED